MSFPLKVPSEIRGFYFFSEKSLVSLMSAEHLSNKDRGRTQRYCFAQTQANQTNKSMMSFDIIRRNNSCITACFQVTSFYF